MGYGGLDREFMLLAAFCRKVFARGVREGERWAQNNISRERCSREARLLLLAVVGGSSRNQQRTCQTKPIASRTVSGEDSLAVCPPSWIRRKIAAGRFTLRLA